MAKRKTITNKKGNAIAESDSDSDAHSTRRTARERTTSSPKPKSKKQKGQEYDSDDHSKASHQTARARASTKPAQQKGQESKPPRRTARVRTASAKAMNPKGQESDSDDPPKVPLRNRAPKPKENKQKNVAPRQPARARATEAPQPRATEAPQPEEQNSSDSDDLSVEEDHRTKQPRAASSKPKEKEIRDHLAILLSLLPSGAPAVIPSSTPNFPRKAKGRKPTNQSEAEPPVGETNRQELDQFPAPALVARDRAPRKVNTGAKRKYPFGHEKATPEPKVPFHTRLLQFPQRGLAIQNGKLVCSVCPTGLSNRKGTIRTHLNSSDHKGALARNDHLIQDQQQIEQLILDRDETKRVPGQSLILPERVFRFRVERALIADGVPSSQFHNGKLKELLEQASGYTFPKDHLTSEITMIHDTEMMNLREDLKSAHQIALVFDACTEVSEVFSIIARYWNDSGLQQRLVSLYSRRGRTQLVLRSKTVSLTWPAWLGRKPLNAFQS